MAKIPVAAKDLAPDAHLLPIEELRKVDGIEKMVPIRYLANCTSASDKVSSTSGKGYLELTWSLYVPGRPDRVHIRDMMSYDPAALFKLRTAVQVFKLNPDTLDTDDFLDLFAWVTIKHEEFKPAGATDMTSGEQVILKNNKIDNYVGIASPDDVGKVMGVPTDPSSTEDSPF